MPTHRCRRIAALAAFLGALAPGVGGAQEAPLELARDALLREAEAAARRGDHTRAIEVARRAAALRPTPSVAHFLAREHEALSQHLEALAHATACTRGAEADRALHNREALLTACRALAARVTERVGRVVVTLPEPLPPGLTVRVAGSPLPAALLGIPYAVEPGLVRVEAEAPGYQATRREVTVEAGRVETLALQLPAVPPPDPPPPPPDPPPPPPPGAPPPVPAVVRPARGPWVAVGVGLSVLAAGSLVASGVVYGLADEAQADRDAACPSPCAVTDPGYPAALGHDQRYRDHLTAIPWTLVAGASLAVGATLWWWLARPAGRRVVPTVSVRADGVGAGLSTRW